MNDYVYEWLLFTNSNHSIFKCKLGAAQLILLNQSDFLGTSPRSQLKGATRGGGRGVQPQSQDRHLGSSGFKPGWAAVRKKLCSHSTNSYSFVFRCILGANFDVVRVHDFPIALDGWPMSHSWQRCTCWKKTKSSRFEVLKNCTIHFGWKFHCVN